LTADKIPGYKPVFAEEIFLTMIFGSEADMKSVNDAIETGDMEVIEEIAADVYARTYEAR